MTENPESMLFESTARAFLDREAPIARVRQLHDEGIAFDREWWTRAAELGWTALLVSEGLGGGSVSGNPVEDLARLARLLGRTVAPGPLHPVSTVLAGLVDAATGAEAADHSAMIQSLVEGSAIATWAVYEPGGGWDPLGSRTEVVAVDDGYRINGEKDRVEAGDDADVLLVVARGEDGVRQLLVPVDAPGVTIEAENCIDMVKHYARVRFDDVPLPARSAVGTVAETQAIIARQSQVAQVLQCAEVVGILDAVMEFTIQWALDRSSFGRPLASYQALKHQFADMKMWQEACKATTTAAVSGVASRSDDAALLVSVAKSYVGERAGAILQQAVQLHGGIGVTWEHDLHVYLRRVVLYRALFGTPEEHNLAVYTAQERRREVAVAK